MIAYLEGKLRIKKLEGLVVDVGGVGYGVTVSATTLAKLPRQGEPCFLHVHTNVHERGIDLYGFYSELERRVFRLLTGISGIGPRVAVGILSAVEVPELVEAVGTEDVKRLTRIPGIGKKTAQRLVVELQEKLKKMALTGAISAPADPLSDPLSTQEGQRPQVGEGGSQGSAVFGDVHSALCNMGYKAAQVDKALQEVKKNGDVGAITLEEVLRAALKLLHRPTKKGRS